MSKLVNRLEELLELSKTDNTVLEELSWVFVNLMVSGDRQWITQYGEQVTGALEAWKGKYRQASALGHLLKGFVLHMENQFQDGLEEFNKAFSLCDDTSLFKNIKGNILLGKAIANRALGNMDEVMRFVVQADHMIDEKDEAKSWHTYIKGVLGEVHIFIGEFEDAEKHLKKAVDVMDKLKEEDSSARFRVYIKLGVCYGKMGRTEQSIEYFKKTLALDGLSPGERARALCDMGSLRLEGTDKALEALAESCSIRKAHGLENAYSTSLLYMAECYILIKAFDEAEKDLEEAGTIVTKYNVPAKMLHFFELKKELNNALGNSVEEARYYRLYDELREKTNAEQVKNILMIKNNLIADQHKEIEQKHLQLKNTLQELARIKVSKKALFFSIVTVVGLVISTEVFLDPVIEGYTGNTYLGLAAKVLIAFLLKPIDSLYERLLFRKAVRE